MKIGTRFLLLTLSLIATPVVIGGALGVAQWLTDGWARSLGSYTVTRRWLDRTVHTAESAEEIMRGRPDGVQLAIADEAGRLVAGTLADAEAGTELSIDRLLEQQAGDRAPEVLVVPLPNLSEAAFLVAQFDRPRVFQARPSWVPGLGLPIILLAPVIAISLWILRDLRRSIMTLRDAAVRISAGDLEFELSTAGNDEFAEVRSSFETMRRTIREEYGRRARFTLGVSHDLKTPLALIKGYAEAIEDGYASDPAKLERYVRIIRERSDLLQERIAHLIEFLKLSTGEWYSTLKPVRLAGFLAECVADASADARLTGRSIQSEIALPAELVLRFDPVLVRRALENLIHNALSHSAADAWVRVRAWLETASVAAAADPNTTPASPPRASDLEPREGRRAVIEVANGGEAIPAADLATLAEPFYRGDSARSGSGVGLGLSVVRSVVESHGWSLTIDDSVPGETRLVIEIPLHPAATVAAR